MFKAFSTLLRSRSNDLAVVLTDTNALAILRQQLRDCASGVEKARRAVAVVMAYAERERKSLTRVEAQIADLETRAVEALSKGRDDLAAETAGAIAQLEAERDTTVKAIATYDVEIASLRSQLADSEVRLRELERGQRLAVAADQTHRLRNRVPMVAASDLGDAEATLARIQERHSQAEAARAALIELTAASSAEALKHRLAAAGIGAPLRPDAALVLERLRKRAA